MKRKALAIVCTAAMAVGGTFLLNAANSPTKAAVPDPFTSSQHFAGYSTGTDVFADALKNLQPGTELANANIGYSAAAANSDGLLSQYVPAIAKQPPANVTVNPQPGVAAFPAAGKGIVNEMGHSVVPPTEVTFGNTPTGAFQSYGRGSGLEVGLGTNVPNNPDLNQIIVAGMAEQMAPPKTPGGNTFPDDSITREVGPVPADPLLFASLLKGQAAANWDASHCPGDPTGTFPVNATGLDASGGLAANDSTKALGWGLGNAAQVELINSDSGPLAVKLGQPTSKPVVSTTGGQPTNRQVSTAKSFTHLVPKGDGTYALVSETHETIAPVTLFKGTANQLTIEVLGEAVLKSVVTGTGATTKVTYTPPPLVRIFPPGQPPQDIPFPAGGSNPPVQVAIPGMPGQPNLLELFLGEPARAPDQAVAGNSHASKPVGPVIDTTNGTLGWAAVDLIRVRLLVPDPISHLAEVREGHMEVQGAVPAGGITCNTAVVPGGSSTTTAAGGATTTTAAGGATTTTAATTPGGATTTTTAAGATTTTTANTPGGGTTPSGSTTTTAANNNNANNNVTTATTAPPQVQAVTFSQTPAATPQSQTPNFTG